MRARLHHFKASESGGMESFAGNDSTAHGDGLTFAKDPFIPKSGVNFLDRWIALKMLQFLGQPAMDLVLWDGTTVSSGVRHPIGKLHFRDRASLYLSLLRPELYWGDKYSAGRVEVEGDLSELLDTVYQGQQRGEGWRWLHQLHKLLTHRRFSRSSAAPAGQIARVR